MKLTKEEIDLFYKLYYSLLCYVNKKSELIPTLKKPDDVKHQSIDDMELLRKELYNRKEYIEFYVYENPDNFSEEELTIIESWCKSVNKTFYIVKYTKQYTVFLDIIEPPKAYGVLSFSRSFEEMMDSKLPIMVDAVLLPFKNKIIFDSLLFPYAIQLNIQLKKILKNAFFDAQQKYGIILSLENGLEEKTPDPLDELKFYLKTERLREVYKTKIQRLINDDPALLSVYHYEMGKIYARSYRKKMKVDGKTGNWVGVFEDIVMAQGESKEDVQRIINENSNINDSQRSLIYIFKV